VREGEIVTSLKDGVEGIIIELPRGGSVWACRNDDESLMVEFQNRHGKISHVLLSDEAIAALWSLSMTRRHIPYFNTWHRVVEKNENVIVFNDGDDHIDAAPQSDDDV
jgi:hypothetical protein